MEPSPGGFIASLAVKEVIRTWWWSFFESLKLVSKTETENLEIRARQVHSNNTPALGNSGYSWKYISTTCRPGGGGGGG